MAHQKTQLADDLEKRFGRQLAPSERRSILLTEQIIDGEQHGPVSSDIERLMVASGRYALRKA